MRKTRLVIAGATLLAATLTMSACGTRSADTGTGSSSTGTKSATIGVISPLTGDLSALGLGIQHSVELAVKQANDNNTVPGWKFEVEAEDDQATPDVGRNAATKLAGNKSVIGVVGTLNSSVAQTVQPVLAGANIAMVSPANTNPSLTQGANYLTAPKRSYPNYFRVCTTDAVQGPFAAQYLYQNAKITQVATINDKKAYGQGLVQNFSTEFKKLGGTLVSEQTINPDDKDFSAVISKVKATNPKAVYYGGEYPQAGPLAQQMKAAGLNVPLMGGDGIFDPAYIELAGKKSDGDLATSVGAPTDKLDSAKAFVDAYTAGNYPDPYGAYGAQAFDAANAIINAAKTSLASATDVASALTPTIDALGKVSFDGATGKVAFDQYGDTTTRVLTVYKVTNGKWAAEETKEFQ
ncbi:MAG: branched-chain amino acid ABC transporter substrate-binding protein [Propionibacteriaceae bacterium]